MLTSASILAGAAFLALATGKQFSIPGGTSGHVHTYAGSSNFDQNMNFTTARAGNCSTSYVQDDMSGYWAPQLYYKYRNGTYYAIQGDGLVAYWKFAADKPDEEFHVVPDDFRIVAGNITRDHWDPEVPAHVAVSFQCINPGRDHQYGWIPADEECEWIRPQVFFPGCWNGVDAFKEDGSHVAYPLLQYESGPCPDSYPYRIPQLFLEAYYKVKDNVPDYEWYPGCLVLANGDVSGFTYHADWLNGWPSGLLVQAGKECALGGSTEGCELLERTQDDDKAFNCVSQGTVIDEAIGLNLPLAMLPGNNPEYNASRYSANPKKSSKAGYVDDAKPVPLPADGSGSCTVDGRRRCKDYDGATGGGDMAQPDAGGNMTTGGMEDANTGSTGGAGSSSEMGMVSGVGNMGGMSSNAPTSTISSDATTSTVGVAMVAVSSPFAQSMPQMFDADAMTPNAGVKTVTVTQIVSNNACTSAQTMRKRRLRSE